MARTRRPNAIDALMAEHIQLPGAPQIIVTRGWAYTFFRDELGYDPHARGFASLDYLVFGKRATEQPLTDMTIQPVRATLALMKQHAAA